MGRAAGPEAAPGRGEPAVAAGAMETVQTGPRAPAGILGAVVFVLLSLALIAVLP